MPTWETDDKEDLWLDVRVYVNKHGATEVMRWLIAFMGYLLSEIANLVK